jgi:hypothetical protein
MLSFGTDLLRSSSSSTIAASSPSASDVHDHHDGICCRGWKSGTYHGNQDDDVCSGPEILLYADGAGRESADSETG